MLYVYTVRKNGGRDESSFLLCRHLSNRVAVNFLHSNNLKCHVTEYPSLYNLVSESRDIINSRIYAGLT